MDTTHTPPETHTTEATVEVPQDPELPVVLYEVRNYTIGYYDKRDALEQAAIEKAQRATGAVAPTAQPVHEHVLLPGLNWVPQSTLEKARVFTPKSRTNVKVRLVDIVAADEVTKHEVLEMTTSREALAKWASRDRAYAAKIERELLRRAKEANKNDG